MFCYYNSYEPEFKQPFGAIRSEQTVVFNLHVPCDFGEINPHFVLQKDGKNEIPVHYPMYFVKSINGENHFTFSIAPEDVGLYFYHFDLYSDYRCVWRGENGESYISAQKGERWQLTVFEKDFETPENLKGKVFYQIFPDRFFECANSAQMKYADRFYQADKTAEPAFEAIENGGKLTLDYYGGNIAGIIEKLPYLQNMGVDFIYLNPIFEAHSNHRYNTADYKNIDPLLGTNEDFTKLCTLAKKCEIGIILDGVFSHTGDDSIYFNKYKRYGNGGAFNDENSKYRPWFHFSNIYEHGYRSWWGFKTLPEVNEENPDFIDFITGDSGVIDTWLSRGASGFRLDVADELPDHFIEKIRLAVKKHGDDKYLLGEVWEDATTKIAYNVRRTYLLGKGLDSVMNYPFRGAILAFLQGKPIEQTTNTLLSICENYPAPALNTMFNFLSTHDTERFFTQLCDEPSDGRNREWQSGRKLSREKFDDALPLIKMAYAMLYTLPGLPSIYYGDEIAMQGYRDPFNRAFFDWNSTETRIRETIEQLGNLRHTCEAFADGQFKIATFEHDFLHYKRIGKTETADIMLNRGDSIKIAFVKGKAVYVNPKGFTITVSENEHNPDHSYYDVK